MRRKAVLGVLMLAGLARPGLAVAEPTAEPDLRKLARSAAVLTQDAGTPACLWLGKRTIQALTRDDMVAATDFHRFYIAFRCPPDHLAAAFSCAVDGDLPAEAAALKERIDGCWNPQTRGAAPQVEPKRTVAPPGAPEPAKKKPGSP